MPLLWLSLCLVFGVWLGGEFPNAGRVQPWLWGAAGAALFATHLCLRGARLYILLPGLVRTLTSRIPPRLLQVTLRSRIWITRRLYDPPSGLALLSTMCFGIAIYTMHHPYPSLGFLADYNDRAGVTWVVRGVLAQPVDVRDGFVFVHLQADKLRSEPNQLFFSVEGLLLARIDDRFAAQQWEYGDYLELSGDLSTPAENELFSYRDYLAHKGIFSVMSVHSAVRLAQGPSNWRKSLYAARAWASNLIFRLYPDPEASLVSGILLGLDHAIAQDVRAAFNLTGTSHIIAISGFNITILAVALQRLLGQVVGRWRGTLLAILGIIIYALLTGAQPSAMRATWMGCALLLGQQIGRAPQSVNSLAFVAALMCMDNPDVLWDSGFQLSFAATLGLALLTTPMSTILQGLLEKRIEPALAIRVVRTVSEYFLVTLAAQVAVLPLLLASSAQLSWTALPANLLILPAQPPLMIIAGLSLLAGLAWTVLGQGLAWGAWAFAAYTIRIVEWFAGMPGPRLVGGPGEAWLVLLLFGAAFTAWLFWPPAVLRARLAAWLRPGLLVVALAVLSWVIWSDVARLPDGRLHLTLLDVNTPNQSGESVLIKTPGGRFVLINGGPSVNRLSQALGRRLPLSHRHLDWLVIGGVEDGQLAALPTVIQRYSPGHVLWAGGTLASPAASLLHTALLQSALDRQPAAAGQVLELEEGLVLRVLAVGPRGAVLLLEYENFRAMLPVGPDAGMLAQLDPASIGRVTAWLLAGSGYAPLNPPQWVEHLRPEVILLSVAPADARGLPSPDTLASLQGYNLLRTDVNGWIELVTDGEQMWVQVEKIRQPGQ